MQLADLVAASSGYPGLFALCALSGIAVPFPEDIPLLYAGMQVHAGTFAWAPTLAVAMAGVLTRDFVAYGLGRWVGGWVLKTRLGVRVVGEARIARAHALFDRHGSRAVFAGRFLIGMRAPVFLVAGAMEIPPLRFLAWDALGAMIAVPGVVILGHVVGAPLVDAALWVMRSSRWAAAAIALGVVAFVVWRSRRAAAAQPPHVDRPAGEVDDQ